MMISASLANTDVVIKRRTAARKILQNQDLFFTISTREYCLTDQPFANKNYSEPWGVSRRREVAAFPETRSIVVAASQNLISIPWLETLVMAAFSLTPCFSWVFAAVLRR